MRFVHHFFFGNYFYGLCTIALSIEANLQQRYPLNGAVYYIILFLATVLFYTAAYITDAAADTNNKRSVWYAENKRMVRTTQTAFAAALIIYACWFIIRYSENLLFLPLVTWGLLLLFPLTGALYYGLSGKGFGKYNLRRIGWLKPFVIGFTWAGLVTVYPVLFYDIENGFLYQPSLVGLFLFIKNFMFITVLCIMFDVKDYAVDHNLQIKTFVVTNGLRYTIFFILLPLCIIGLGSFIYYGLSRHFHSARIAFNIIPFVALITVAYSMHRRRSILYYLIIIDGLMLVKAICGIAGMQYS